MCHPSAWTNLSPIRLDRTVPLSNVIVLIRYPNFWIAIAMAMFVFSLVRPLSFTI
jgi:hypothetical protein